MRPLPVPSRKVLHTRRTLACLIIHPKPGMLHLAALLHKQTYQRVFRHGGDLALPQPVGTIIPLAGSPFALQVNAHLFQAPIGKSPAVEAPDPLPAGQPFTPGAGILAPVQNLAFRNNRLMIIPFPFLSFSRRTFRTPGPENVRPVHAQKSNAPNNPPGLRPGSLPLFNHGSHIFCCIHFLSSNRLI